MSLTLTKITETSSTITLGWTPPANVKGYVFTANGQPTVATANNKDGSPRKEVKFSKSSPGPPFQVAAVCRTPEGAFSLEVGTYSDAVPPPPPGDYLWPDPVLTNPTVRTLTDAARTVPKGSGQDLQLLTSGTLRGQIGQVEGYNDVLAVGGKIEGGTFMSQGHIIPRECTGTFMLRDWDIRLPQTSDALCGRWRCPRFYIVNCYIEVTSTENGVRPPDQHHADGYQTQQAMHDELGFDRVTIKTDYQGVFLNNEVSTHPEGIPSQVKKTIMSRLLFLPGIGGEPYTYFFKGIPSRTGLVPGPVEMYDVWMPITNALAHIYPNGHTWKAWDGSNNLYGAFLEQRVHANGRTYPFVRFSTSSDKVPAGKPLAGQTCGDCGVRGEGGIWLYQSLSDVPAGVGASVS